ncbi:MAG: hypothetical protein P8Z68_11260, partial [Kineosporiaceae bacterium]
PRLPEVEAAAAGVGPGERVLAWAPIAGGGVAVAVPDGLRATAPGFAGAGQPGSGTVASGQPEPGTAASGTAASAVAGPGSEGGAVPRPWTDVDRVAWDAASGTLAVWWVGARHPFPLELAAPGRLPAVVRERVESSVVISQELEPEGGGRVVVAVRRAADGTLSLQVVAGPGVRLDDPGVAGQVAAIRAALAEDAGLPPDRE